MVYAHVFENHSKANMGFVEYVRMNKDSISRAIDYKNVVIDKDQNEHKFISQKGFLRWRIGRTYMLPNGKLMHGCASFRNRNEKGQFVKTTDYCDDIG